jgi:hypothetical protein
MRHLVLGIAVLGGIASGIGLVADRPAGANTRTDSGSTRQRRPVRAGRAGGEWAAAVVASRLVSPVPTPRRAKRLTRDSSPTRGLRTKGAS